MDRPLGRKRYCCYYCNTYFYQVDAWQRHNRKHTGVEIECVDCGQMCSDHFELRVHQNVCAAYSVYSENVYTQAPGEGSLSANRQNSIDDRANENVSVHETPDSTSKQESIPENDSNLENRLLDVVHTPKSQEITPSFPQKTDCRTLESPELEDKDLSTNPELDHLIGEDKEQIEHREDEDPETEALIGIDESEVSQMNSSEHNAKTSGDSSVDSQIVINVESALNSVKPNHDLSSSLDSKNMMDMPSFLNQPSPVGSSVVTQAISLDGSDMNKKYQPYFCKNCGARFTRKDSVTRHLKKGTCSGKSAIVCNICGKVFAEMFELQEHFKTEHKNVVFTPTVVHRSILPRAENHETQPPYAPFPTHYIVHDQHMVHVSRPYHPVEQTYRPMPPALQTMFYGGQSSFGPRPVHPPPTAHYHEQMLQPRPMELKYSPTGHVGKDLTYINNPGKLIVNRGEEINRKRDHPDLQLRMERQEDNEARKVRKIEMEYPVKQSQPSSKYMIEKVQTHDSINLSEYTTNAMSSKQYYNNRFTKKEPSAGKDEPPRAHQCKVCGLEFPRFEYLLTHLRKHKEKNEVEPFDENHKENFHQHNKNREIKSNPTESELISSKMTTLNDSNSSSSDDSNDAHNKPNFVMSNFQDKVATIHSSTHEPMPIVIPQPHHHYGLHPPPNEHYLVPHDPSFPSHHSQLGNQSLEGGPVEAITPGVDGKFRPFICENCGQRFTRKDSLVRHAKKQTCFDEAVELKCKHCEKTFRYHKCLVQHQELVHGIPQGEQKHSDDEHSDSESEKNEDSNKFQLDEEQRFRMQREHDGKMVIKPSKYGGPSGTYFQPYPDRPIHDRQFPDGQLMHDHDRPFLDGKLIRDRPFPDSQVRSFPDSQPIRDHRSFHDSQHMRERPFHDIPNRSFHDNRDRPFHDHLPVRDRPAHDSQLHKDRSPRPGKTNPDPAIHDSHENQLSSEQSTATPKITPPKQDEKMKPHDSNSKNQDSNYIGYCMLPRPFQCEYCGDRFAHRHSLKRHVRRHLGIGIPCHDCGKLYRDQSEWRRHQRSIHNRHYEKYEVPSRMSFRDGIDQGLIGIVPNSEYENHMGHDDISESDNDEDASMVKVVPNYESPQKSNAQVVSSTKSSFSSRLSNFGFHNAKGQANEAPVKYEENADHIKEEKIMPFDFKSHTGGDKDSRKSVLDLYLCSPNSDDGDPEKNNNNGDEPKTHI